MTDTDNITDISKAQEDRAMKRYKALLEFLDAPLAAASDAAHELPNVGEDDRAFLLGFLNMDAVQLCPPKLWLLSDLAHRLLADEAHGADEPADPSSEH